MCIQLRTRLHRQTHRQLNSELYRELREQLHSALYHALFAKLFETLFEKTFASLFGSMFGSKSRSLWASIYLALYRQRPRGRRPPGRSPHARIVARDSRTTICRRQARILAGGIVSTPEPIHPSTVMTRNRQHIPPVPRRSEAGDQARFPSEARCTKRQMNKSRA